MRNVEPARGEDSRSLRLGFKNLRYTEFSLLRMAGTRGLCRDEVANIWALYAVSLL